MTLHSTCLPSGRRLTIYLPPGFVEDPPVPYPLLVLHDGQNLFEGGRAYIPGEHWRVGETANDLIDAGLVPPVVIVGIDHARKARIREFTPTPGSRRLGGDAAEYASLVVDDVLPDVRKQYPVRRDRAGLSLGGSSLGGLVTLYIAAMHAKVFGGLLVMSPSVWWDRRIILRVLRERPIEPDVRVWIDIGLNEGTRALTDARRLRDAIDGPEHTGAFHYEEDPDGDHSERAWARRLPAALAFLFGTPVSAAGSRSTT
jgi:enterochelin esterase-like enzyme